VKSDSSPTVLTSTVLAAFAAVVVVLAITLVIGLRNLRNVYEASEATAHTYAVKLELRQLLALLVDAETGERGFIITGQEPYLEPYTPARNAVPSVIARLRALMADEPAQQTDVNALATIANEKLTELAAAIRQRRESGFSAAQAVVATNVGKRTMDRVRQTVARVEAREDAALATRLARTQQDYQAARLTRFGTTALAMLAVIALFLVTQRYGRERALATQTAERQAAQLREALQQKDEFVAIVSHELRTPMNTVVGWMRMLEDGTMRPERTQTALASVRRNADSMRQLLDDLMDTNQLASGRMRLAAESVAVDDVVRDAIETVRLSAENKGVALVETIESELPTVRGDAGRLKQIVWNILANAIKFTPKSGTVTIALTTRGAGVQLEVRDTGEGIDPMFLPHVFERNRQGATSPALHRGVGLGLAIVRHLVELHGGTVAARSGGPGQGTTFIVELPVEAPTPAPVVEFA
jgi:signal transduction histidine kinase